MSCSANKETGNWGEVISRQTKAIGVATACLFLEVVGDAHSYHYAAA